MKQATDMFLELAAPENREQLEYEEPSCWNASQQQFLQMIDRYLEIEMNKPVDASIHMHEAGGQFRIAFPHYAVRGDERILESMKNCMDARKAYTDAHFFHGFPDCCEVHHEIETFIYFQMPLFYWKHPGKELALQSIEDVAHHIGNWSEDAPAWYDWNRHEFVSNWVGTRKVRDYPPYDYQEANHFRYSDVAMAAYLGTGSKRYLDFMCDYADRWCDHIEHLAAQGKPIQCSILPHNVEASEMGYSGSRKDNSTDYKIFYNLVSDNTAYDITGHLLDLYWVTGLKRYIEAARMMMDQFIANGTDGRPAINFSQGKWKVIGEQRNGDLNAVNSFITDCTFLARLALRHDMLTGTDTYREAILEWAAQIDEKRNAYDQMVSNLLVAAHFYDGNPSWLSRAYAMALRTSAVVEANDQYHQCNWAASRQGTKFLMEMLYTPIVGGVEWGTRGNIPILLFKHQTDLGEGIPADVSFRTWRVDKDTFGFEAVNMSQIEKQWEIGSCSNSFVQVKDAADCIIRLKPGETVSGQIRIDHEKFFSKPFA